MKIPKPDIDPMPDMAQKPDDSSLYITAIFIDIEDSTGIANHYKSLDYRDFLSKYHDIVRSVVYSDPIWKPIQDQIYHNFLGDEFMAFLVHDSYNQHSASKALELATKLKLAWYVSTENEERLNSDKEVIEVNVGVNFGAVFSMNYPLPGPAGGKEKTLEGFPITVAKRAQAVCDQARASRIILADAAYRQYVAETKSPHEFDYLGRQPLKGLAQSMSCYEWLGGDYDNFKNYFPHDQMAGVLEKLYHKNPLNPWYALLLAYYFYKVAEDEWYKSSGVTVSNFYNKAAGICLKAIQSITGARLRQLSSLLLTCLEVQGRWEELGHRADHAFGADQTFAQASALNAWAIFRPALKDKEKVASAAARASRTVILFERDTNEENNMGAQTEEALYRAHVIRAQNHCMARQNDDAQSELKSAIEYAIRARLDWAETELIKLKEEGAFTEMRKEVWASLMDNLKKAFIK